MEAGAHLDQGRERAVDVDRPPRGLDQATQSLSTVPLLAPLWPIIPRASPCATASDTFLDRPELCADWGLTVGSKP